MTVNGAMEILHMLNDADFEAFIVGGAVRDLLLKRPIRDVDVCTNASVTELKTLFPRSIDVGIKHGTVVVPIEGQTIEVSQYKRTSVTEPLSIFTDLSYRDFTCNAMAMSSNGEIIDPFRGKEALQRKKIQVVNNNKQRFIEDPLRLLRGLRLASELGFTIEDNTEVWMVELASLIQHPAKERVASELEKLFQHPLYSKTFKSFLLQRVTEEIPLIFPERSRLLAGLANREEFHLQGSLELWVMAAFSFDETETLNILKTYKRSKKLTTHVTAIVKNVLISIKESCGQLSNYQLYVLGEAGIQAAGKLLTMLTDRTLPLSQLNHQYKQLPIHSLKQLVVTGNDVIQWFPEKSGSWIGEALNKVEREIVSQRLTNDKQDIYHWLKRESLS